MEAGALSAAVSVAEDLGLRFDRAEMLRESSNLLVRLAPLPVVARVPAATAAVRAGSAWLRREVAVASWLAAAGAPVVAPSGLVDDPGPHVHDGLAVTLWELVEELPGPADPELAGRALRECHEALVGFEGASPAGHGGSVRSDGASLPRHGAAARSDGASLPRHGAAARSDGASLPRHGALMEARSLVERLAETGELGSGDAARLRAAGSAALTRIEALGLPRQAVHGDAHLGNVLNTAAGPLWTDWEDACLAPRAWDLGCMHAHAGVLGRDLEPILTAQRGYGEALDEPVLDPFVEARRLQLTAWSVVMLGQGLISAREVERRLARYR